MFFILNLSRIVGVGVNKKPYLSLIFETCFRNKCPIVDNQKKKFVWNKQKFWKVKGTTKVQA